MAHQPKTDCIRSALVKNKQLKTWFQNASGSEVVLYVSTGKPYKDGEQPPHGWHDDWLLPEECRLDIYDVADIFAENELTSTLGVKRERWWF